jgi:hypothetical protein
MPRGKTPPLAALDGLKHDRHVELLSGALTGLFR